MPANAYLVVFPRHKFTDSPGQTDQENILVEKLLLYISIFEDHDKLKQRQTKVQRAAKNQFRKTHGLRKKAILQELCRDFEIWVGNTQVIFVHLKCFSTSFDAVCL